MNLLKIVNSIQGVVWLDYPNASLIEGRLATGHAIRVNEAWDGTRLHVWAPLFSASHIFHKSLSDLSDLELEEVVNATVVRLVAAVTRHTLNAKPIETPIGPWSGPPERESVA